MGRTVGTSAVGMSAGRVWAGLAVGAFCLVAVSGCDGSEVPGASAPVSSFSSLSPAASPAAPAPDLSTPGVVERVIDGDTFELVDGTTVRVLGIDSCEADTPGGRRATQEAEGLLLGTRVTMTSEPGVDLDRYDRALRHVQTDGRDFASEMVGTDHTAIYDKAGNDSSAEVQAALAALDVDGRTCGTDEPEPESEDPESESESESGSDGSDSDTARAERAPARPEVAPEPATAPQSSSGGSSSGGSSSGSASSGGSASGPFANCSAAREAGAAPVRAGDPGYSRKLDRDGDGVGCE